MGKIWKFIRHELFSKVVMAMPLNINNAICPSVYKKQNKGIGNFSAILFSLPINIRLVFICFVCLSVMLHAKDIYLKLPYVRTYMFYQFFYISLTFFYLCLSFNDVFVKRWQSESGIRNSPNFLPILNPESVFK